MTGGTAAALLRRARESSELSQAQLGNRAGVTQSVISAYESGRRQPSFPMLLKLITAAGHDLDVTLVPRPTPRAPLSGPLGKRVHQLRREIKQVAAAHGASSVQVFGSVARGTDGPTSDVDLLMELPEAMGLFGLGRLRLDLERVVGAPVDVVPTNGIKAEVRARVIRDLVSL